MDSRCTYIIGFDIHNNDELRNNFVRILKEELKAEIINQSCYKMCSNISVVAMQDRLAKLCKECSTNYGQFNQDDFVKLYCAACNADYNTEHKFDIYEYNINI